MQRSFKSSATALLRPCGCSRLQSLQICCCGYQRIGALQLTQRAWYPSSNISKVKSDHPGRLYSSASLFSRNFWIDGPNVKCVDPARCHLALKLLARQIAYMSRLELIRVTQGLKYLHPGGIFNEEGYLERDVCRHVSMASRYTHCIQG